MSPRRQPLARAGPRLESLEERLALTAFTLTSPTTAGELPASVTPVGGIVLDLIGLNGRRVVSQLPAGRLFVGRFDSGAPFEFRGNPGTIGVQAGFTPAVLAALGGGIRQAAIRVTILDGDTAPGDFDFAHNTLHVNGVPFGDFSAVATEETTADGLTTLSVNPVGGFRNDLLDTGFFLLNDAGLLADLFVSLRSGIVVFQVSDADPFENVFDFTQGVSGDLIDVGTPPQVDVPDPGSSDPDLPTLTLIPPPPAPDSVRIPEAPTVAVVIPPGGLVVDVEDQVPIVPGRVPGPERIVPVAGGVRVVTAKPTSSVIGPVVELGQMFGEQFEAAGRGAAAVLAGVLDQLAIDVRRPVVRAPVPLPIAISTPEDAPADPTPRPERGGAVQTGILVLAALLVMSWQRGNRPPR
jgi:hypothetical protein